jgi:hypothetical protein
MKYKMQELEQRAENGRWCRFLFNRFKK